MKSIKRMRKNITIGFCLAFSVFMVTCSEEYLEIAPIGQFSENILADKRGLNALLIGAYSLLDGFPSPPEARWWNAAADNWVFGLAGDETYKGSNFGDEAFMENIENYTPTPVDVSFNDKWRTVYSGVVRSNDVLRLLIKVNDPSLSPEEAKQIKAEAIFLRTVYHFEAAKLWRNIPYVDETISFANGNYNVSNEQSIWPKLEADFKFAADNLSSTKPQRGRVNSWAAKAFLAKVYMFQSKFAEAKLLLDDIIANGVNSSGVKYALMPMFFDNFNALKKNNSETVFSVQQSVNDGSAGMNSNFPGILNFGWGSAPVKCCGFNQPSQAIVNSFQVDNEGLPLIFTFNSSNVKSDLGLSSSIPFTPYTGLLDPRLDYTVGRRGIPFLDWGIMGGNSWIRNQSNGGPYLQIKSATPQKQRGITDEASQGWNPGAGNAINYNYIRFADVLLWAAEVEVEIGSLAKAEEYVNRIRNRAANMAGWVYTYKNNSDPLEGFTNIPAANYRIGLYNGHFAANGQNYAREAIRFERKLEFAMEGHRIFDLQRYDRGTGYMADQLNAYVAATKSYWNSIIVSGIPLSYDILKNANFSKGKNEIFPIPQDQIDLMFKDGKSVLKQNPGY